MKQHPRYLQVVHPGMVSGVAFVTAYEIRNFRATANDDLSGAVSADGPVKAKSRQWAQATQRFLGAFRRRVPLMLRRNAAA